MERALRAADAGFAGIEMVTVEDPAKADRIREAAERSGLRIHSVMSTAHRRHPLSSADREVARKSVAGVETSLRNAKLWGADAVLLANAEVDPGTSYRDAWTRSQSVIRERILPLARELEVVVAVEGVWNRFLLGPLEVARYIDELDSPWVKTCHDVGNVVFYAYPQDWIRALGPRIASVHLKDFRFDRAGKGLQWKNIGDGEIDWPAVRQALIDIGYDGWVTTEIAGGDAAYLRDAAARVDRLLG